MAMACCFIRCFLEPQLPEYYLNEVVLTYGNKKIKYHLDVAPGLLFRGHECLSALKVIKCEVM